MPEKLLLKLEDRKATNSLRALKPHTNLIDLSSNDYLGFSRSETLFNNSYELLKKQMLTQNGATGSRLISGNHPLFDILESTLTRFHNSESALIFNSGYDANVGFFSSVPQRGDIILYDELIHASIRDGILMSHAKSYKFKHNDLNSLSELLQRIEHNGDTYVVTESVFSMDGDSPDLMKLSHLCNRHKAFLIIDEAHAVGVLGKNGCGLVQQMEVEKHVFARIITFGKALGCHGAAILGSPVLKRFLINFARSFIYTTALPPHSLATIISSYNELASNKNRELLLNNIQYFKEEILRNHLYPYFIESSSSIQSCIIPGNSKVKSITKELAQHKFNVKPILSPTVPKGQERLRFCLHSYNSQEEIKTVVDLLKTLLPN